MLYWKKMPSLWVGIKLTILNNYGTAPAIAAIKIFLTFCLFCEKNPEGIRTIKITFSQIGEAASLSRSLVNQGLKILRDEGLILDLSSSPRKKTYTVDVDGELKDGWAKLPFKGVVTEDKTIPAFNSMHNRYPFELLALQLYLYLLYARDNKNDFTLARKLTLMIKLKCKLSELNKAITYLIHIGLLKTIKQKKEEDYPSEMFHDSFYFYMTSAGTNAFTYRKTKQITVREEDLPF
ncbi:hypothetical protein PUG42_25180 [Erwiniaceae bacterium L1_54_3]|nr:hypothetical protein [Erwiniaceae bacterium L1_54_3]